MSKMRVVKDFLSYIAENKKLWLLPLLIILGLVALAALITQAPAVAPLIYSLF